MFKKVVLPLLMIASYLLIFAAIVRGADSPPAPAPKTCDCCKPTCTCVPGKKNDDCKCYPCQCDHPRKPSAGKDLSETFEVEALVFDTEDGVRRLVEVRYDGKSSTIARGITIYAAGKPVGVDGFAKWVAESKVMLKVVVRTTGVHFFREGEKVDLGTTPTVIPVQMPVQRPVYSPPIYYPQARPVYYPPAFQPYCPSGGCSSSR